MAWRLLAIAAVVAVVLQVALGRPELALRDFAFGGISLAIAVGVLLGPFWKHQGGRRKPEA